MSHAARHNLDHLARITRAALGCLCLAGVALGGLCLAGVARAQGPTQEAAPAAEKPEVSQTEQAGRELAKRLDSPRATLRVFIDAMGSLWEDPRAWKQATQCFDLSQVEADDARQSARKLYGALNRIVRIDFDRLPDAEEVAGRKLTSYRLFPERRTQGDVLRKIGVPAGAIVLRPDAYGAWRFSADTLANLPKLFRQLEPLPLVAGSELLTVGDWIETKLPPWLSQREFLTVRYWQWLAIFAVILIGLVADLVVRLAVRGISGRVAARLGAIEDPEQLRRTLRPFGWLACPSSPRRSRSSSR